MHILFSLLCLLTTPRQVTDTFYTVSFTTVDGTLVNTSAYTGKKVLVFPFKGGHPDLGLLRYMDSTGIKYKDSLVVLAFPATDLDSTVSNSSLIHLPDSLGLQLGIAQP